MSLFSLTFWCIIYFRYIPFCSIIWGDRVFSNFSQLGKRLLETSWGILIWYFYWIISMDIFPLPWKLLPNPGEKTIRASRADCSSFAHILSITALPSNVVNFILSSGSLMHSQNPKSSLCELKFSWLYFNDLFYLCETIFCII